MIVVNVVLYALIGAGALLVLIRLALGPSLLDRVVATDALLVIISAGLAVHAALARDPTVVRVLVVVALLAFVGSVSVARYIGGMMLRGGPPDDPGGDAAADADAERRAGA
jgi:multicomponent Na+:H+ antiporter subunit F